MTSAFIARTDLLTQALVDVLSQVCPAQWAYGEPTEDALPESLYTLTWLFAEGQQTHERASSVYTLESFEIDVDTSETGRELAVELNGRTYLVTATNADPATLRGLMLAAINADSVSPYNAPYSAVTAGATGLIVTPIVEDSGTLLSARVPLGGDMVTTLAIHADQPHLVTRSIVDATIQIQAWAPSIAPRLSANLLLAHGQSLLQGPTATDTLRGVGCVIRSWDRIVDLTAIAGARWSSRAAVEAVVSYETQLVTPTTRIQTATTTLEITT